MKTAGSMVWSFFLSAGLDECRNRHFRIIWSSKGGKAAVLMPTHRFDGARAALPPQDQFLSALVCNVTPSSRLMAVSRMLTQPEFPACALPALERQPAGIRDTVDEVHVPLHSAYWAQAEAEAQRRHDIMPVSGRCADGVATLQLDPMKLNACGMLHAAGGRASRQCNPEAGTAGVSSNGTVVVSRKCDAADEAAPACFSFEREPKSLIAAQVPVALKRLLRQMRQDDLGVCGTEIQSWAEAARDFVEEVARSRAGGLAASVRSIAHCGTAGTVTFSMLGEVCPRSA